MATVLIFDLDDTLFETRSLGEEAMRPLLVEFKRLALSKYGEQLTSQILSDLWKYPFDHVAKQHAFDAHFILHIAEVIDKMHFEFDINPFPDFTVVQEMDCTKLLVTTGFKQLQLAKVKALQLEQEFELIVVDDVLAENRLYKKGIFEQIIQERQLDVKDVFVIGDNPESELKAGQDLGLRTVQVVKLGQERSANADFVVEGFAELLGIVG